MLYNMLLHNIIKYCHLYKILLHLYVIINQFFSAIYITIVITDTRFCIHIFVFFIYLFIYLILENIRQSCECNSEKLRRVIARNCKVEFNKTAKYDSTIITILKILQNCQYAARVYSKRETFEQHIKLFK